VVQVLLLKRQLTSVFHQVIPADEGEHSRGVFTMPAVLKVMPELGGSQEVGIERNVFASKPIHIQPRSTGSGEKKKLRAVQCATGK